MTDKGRIMGGWLLYMECSEDTNDGWPAAVWMRSWLSGFWKQETTNGEGRAVVLWTSGGAKLNVEWQYIRYVVAVMLTFIH